MINATGVNSRADSNSLVPLRVVRSIGTAWHDCGRHGIRILALAVAIGCLSWPSVAASQTTLDPPEAFPAAGLYGAPQVVTLEATAGATIRYTVDGSEPWEGSTLYSGPITVSASVELKARAFRMGWTPSETISRLYEIDVAPPVITAKLEPGPNAAGWNRTPVKVVFACVDRSSVACPEAVLVSTEGAQQVISRTAVDEWGHEGSTSVTLNIDLTPPSITVSTPSSDMTTASPTVSVVGQSLDSMSGVVASACNGEAAIVSGWDITCEVSLRPGRNAVVLHSRDLAGNTTSHGIRVTRSISPSQLFVTPSQRVMIVGDVAPLTVTTEFDQVVDDVTWTSSDPSVATVSTTAGFSVTALGTGHATLTASWETLTAEVDVTVVASGSWPADTPRWTITPAPGRVLDSTAAVYAHRVTETGPDFFLIELSGLTWEPESMRAVRADGTVLWTESLPGIVHPWWSAPFGDVYGGIVAPLLDGGNAVTAFARFGGEQGVAPWRHEVQGWVAGRDVQGYTGPAAAQASDGTIYYVEGTDDGYAFVVGLDGASGSEKFRVPVPSQSTKQVFTGLCASLPYPPYHVISTRVLAPTIGPDDAAYLQVAQTNETVQPVCEMQFGSVSEIPEAGTSTVNERLTLMRVDASGNVSFQSLRDVTESGLEWPSAWRQSVATGWPGPVAFDDSGGVLATWHLGRSTGCTVQGCTNYEVETHITRVVSGDSSDHLLYTRPWVGDGSDYPTPIRLVGDQQTAFLQEGDTVSAIDVTTWVTKWSSTNVGVPLSALWGGEVALLGADGVLSHRDANGQVLQASSVLSAVPSQTRLGMWTGVSPAGNFAEYPSLPLNEAPFSFVAQGGNRQGQNAPPLFTYTREDFAAIMATDYLWPYTERVGIEVGGRICKDNDDRYRWGRFRFGLENTVFLNHPVEECPPYGQTVAFFHTHPAKQVSAEVPSGYASALDYSQGGDLPLADNFPAYMWYLMTFDVANLPLRRFLRYKGPTSKNNVWIYSVVTDTWSRIPNAPW